MGRRKTRTKPTIAAKNRNKKSDSPKAKMPTRGESEVKNGKGRLFSFVSALATTIATGHLAALAWAAKFRLDRWEARPFVLLLYGAFIGALVASLSLRRARREDPSAWDSLGPLRTILWLALAAAFLWVWFPPVERIVGWWTRQVSMFRFR